MIDSFTVIDASKKRDEALECVSLMMSRLTERQIRIIETMKRKADKKTGRGRFDMIDALHSGLYRGLSNPEKAFYKDIITLVSNNLLWWVGADSFIVLSPGAVCFQCKEAAAERKAAMERIITFERD